MDLFAIYQEVDAVLRGLDFEKIFPGFHRYRFAIYNSEGVCLDGKMMPCSSEFVGNTSLLYDGEYIAIWNVGFDNIEDWEILACSLVHEMFHCHQNTLGEKRFPSDLKLLQYPEDGENFARKYRENCLLADAYEYTDREALAQFAAIRAMRLQQYPELVREELKTETLEGVAEYVGLKALEQCSGEKFERRVEDYLQRIRGESALQFDIRRISYYTGTVFLLCLQRLGYEVRNEIGADETVYEQNPVAAAENVEIPAVPYAEEEFAKLVADRKQKIREHISSAQFTPCKGEICGYDPMNMFRVEDRIYCSHIVFLKVGDGVETHQRAIVLEMEEGSERMVKGYY